MTEILSEEKKSSIFKVFWKVVKYPLIYFVLQFVSIFIVGIYYGIKYYGAITQAELEKMIMGNACVVSSIVAIICFLIFMMMFKKKEESLWERCKFDKVDAKNILLILLTSIGLSMFLTSFVYLVQNMFPSYESVSKGIILGMNSILGFFSIVFILPFFEEILFRGLVFNELRRSTNIVASIIIQGLLFALIHGNLLQSIYTFLLGIVLALIYLWTKSIWSCVILHISYNLMGANVLPRLLAEKGNLAMVIMICGIILSTLGLFLLNKNKVNDIIEGVIN